MVEVIGVQELQRELSANAELCGLDVRSPAEYSIGHIARTINIPLEQIEARMADIPGKSIVLICEAGKRAEMASQWLVGQRKVQLLDGGVKSWRTAGYPLVACAPCRWSLERQVRLIAGLLVLVGALLAVTVNTAWVYLSMFIGAGLTFAGISNICGMAIVLAKMPWNSESKLNQQAQASPTTNCCT
jgi:rhodanese-related sulfurtransferase